MAVFAATLRAMSAFAAGDGDDPSGLGLRTTLPADSGKGTVAQTGAPVSNSSAGDTGYVSVGEPSGHPRKPKTNKNTDVYVPVTAPEPEPEVPPGTKMNPRIGTVTPILPVRKKPDDEPFDPAGFHAGAFLLKPSFELSEGYDSNPFRVLNGPGSPFTLVKSALAGKSEWERHELSFELRGSYTAYSDVDHNNQPSADAILRGRIDVTRDARIELEEKASLFTQTPGTPDAITGVKQPPLIYSLGTGAGWVQVFNRLELGIYGSAERIIYENADLLSGGTLDLSDSTYNDYTARLRGSYEITPGLKPFAEVAIDTRVFDHEINSFGVRQGSDGYKVEAGVDFDRPDILKGRIGLGVIGRNYKDPTLPNISGLLIDSSLIWRATALTTVKLDMNTSIGESTTTGAAGILTREAKLTIDHSFRRWLIGSLFAGYGRDDYVGIGRVDDRESYGAALTYMVNRELAFRGEVRRELLNSNVPGQDYTANVAMIGLRLQR